MVSWFVCILSSCYRLLPGNVCWYVCYCCIVFCSSFMIWPLRTVIWKMLASSWNYFWRVTGLLLDQNWLTKLFNFTQLHNKLLLYLCTCTLLNSMATDVYLMAYSSISTIFNSVICYCYYYFYYYYYYCSCWCC